MVYCMWSCMFSLYFNGTAYATRRLSVPSVHHYMRTGSLKRTFGIFVAADGVAPFKHFVIVRFFSTIACSSKAGKHFRCRASDLLISKLKYRGKNSWTSNNNNSQYIIWITLQKKGATADHRKLCMHNAYYQRRSTFYSCRFWPRKSALDEIYDRNGCTDSYGCAKLDFKMNFLPLMKN